MPTGMTKRLLEILSADLSGQRSAFPQTPNWRLLQQDKVFKRGLRKICGRQPLKNLHGPLLYTLSHR